MSIGRVFHNEAAAVSIKCLPYFIFYFYWELIVCRSQIEAVSLGDTGSPNSGASSCKDLQVIVNNLNWQRFTTGNQCSCLKIGVMFARGGSFCTARAAALCVN